MNLTLIGYGQKGRTRPRAWSQYVRTVIVEMINLRKKSNYFLNFGINILRDLLISSSISLLTFSMAMCCVHNLIPELSLFLGILRFSTENKIRFVHGSTKKLMPCSSQKKYCSCHDMNKFITGKKSISFLLVKQPQIMIKNFVFFFKREMSKQQISKTWFKFKCPCNVCQLFDQTELNDWDF